MARTRSDIQPRIVNAARNRFLREGVDGAALRAIAADAGTSIGMVYYYFPTKDDLFFAVVEEVYAKLLEDLTRACLPDVSPAERMRRLFRRIGAIDAHESQVVRLVIREVLVSSRRLRRLLQRFQRGHFPVVLDTLAEGIADREIRADLPPLLLLVVSVAVGAVPQFALRELAPHLPRDQRHGELLADRLVDVLFHGIGAPAPAPTPAASAGSSSGRRKPPRRQRRR